MIFKQCNETGVSPSEWEKSDTVSIHMIGNKQTLMKLPCTIVATYLWKNFWKITV